MENGKSNRKEKVDEQFAVFLSKLLSILFLAFVFSLTVNPTFAQVQKQNNIWYFGDHAGIDFNSGSPVAITNSAMRADEGSSVICDTSGNLLFYTNGMVVWNAQHDTMENGFDIGGCYSTSQTLIVPKPCMEDSLYYIFSADCEEQGFTHGLRYSVVDMKLNNGLGKVVEKDVWLSDSVEEKICAVTHSNGHDFWVVTHELNNNCFQVYKVDAIGLETTPQRFCLGVKHEIGGATGRIISNRIGDKIASSMSFYVDSIYLGGIEFCDFDRHYGQITNYFYWVENTGNPNCFSVSSFSPDNTKLYSYSHCAPNSALIQYDITSGDSFQIFNSKQILFTDTNSLLMAFGPGQIGPDLKIYIPHYTALLGIGDTMLGVINNPNISGENSNYIHLGFDLSGMKSIISNSNFIITPYCYINCTANAIYSVENRNFYIYPNPINDYININANNCKKKKCFCQITNMLGNQVIIDISENTKIDFRNYKPGLYEIIIFAEEEIIHKQKIIKQ